MKSKKHKIGKTTNVKPKYRKVKFRPDWEENGELELSKMEVVIDAPRDYKIKVVPELGVKGPKRITVYPGDPSCRSICATEVGPKEIEVIFKLEPSSKWIVTPTRIIERGEFFKK